MNKKYIAAVLIMSVLHAPVSEIQFVADSTGQLIGDSIKSNPQPLPDALLSLVVQSPEDYTGMVLPDNEKRWLLEYTPRSGTWVRSGTLFIPCARKSGMLLLGVHIDADQTHYDRGRPGFIVHNYVSRFLVMRPDLQHRVEIEVMNVRDPGFRLEEPKTYEYSEVIKPGQQFHTQVDRGLFVDFYTEAGKADTESLMRFLDRLTLADTFFDRDRASTLDTFAVLNALLWWGHGAQIEYGLTQISPLKYSLNYYTCLLFPASHPLIRQCDGECVFVCGIEFLMSTPDAIDVAAANQNMRYHGLKALPACYEQGTWMYLSRFAPNLPGLDFDLHGKEIDLASISSYASILFNPNIGANVRNPEDLMTELSTRVHRVLSF